MKIKTEKGIQIGKNIKQTDENPSITQQYESNQKQKEKQNNIVPLHS